MCTYEDHTALKAAPTRVRNETTPLGEMTSDGEIIGYLRNCHTCGSTIMLTPTQHAVLLTTSEGT